MDFEQLEFFLAINRTRHFTLAAEECSISQSSLSKRIKSLETELGVQLLDRSLRSIQITPYGSKFAEFCEETLGKYYRMKSEIKDFGTDNKTVTIGSVPVMSLHGITSLLARFQKEYPEIKVTIIRKEDDMILSLIKTERIDLAFLRTFTALENDFTVYPLFFDEMVLVVSAEHPFAAREHVDLLEATNEKFIFLGLPKIYDFCMKACWTSGFEPNVIHKTTRIETVLEFVSEEVGVSLLMANALSHFSNSRIKTVKLKREIQTSIALVAHKDEKLSPCAALLKDYSIRFSAAQRIF